MTGWIQQIIFQRQHLLLRHLLFWLIYFLVFSCASSLDLGSISRGIETTAIFIPLNALYAYVILYWFVPALLVKEKYVLFFGVYGCWCVTGIILNFLFRHYILIPFRSGRPAPPLTDNAYRQVFELGSFIVMNTVAIFGVFISMFKYWYREQRQKMQFEQEKIRAELELLKSQLHPHFLFNTLNNLYSLVLERSDKAPEMLMRLSGLLSYMLYECKAPEVPLSKEIKVLKDYIELEEERYGSRLEISMDFSGDILDTMIAPMLFQPFVENAFKHGTAEQLGRVWMSIELSVRNKQLFFRVINSVNKGDEVKATGGIGIKNVRRRLELLYPGNFDLHQDLGKDVYIATLTIELGFSSTVLHMLEPINETSI